VDGGTGDGGADLEQCMVEQTCGEGLVGHEGACEVAEKQIY
jgi:hypothetical protein